VKGGGDGGIVMMVLGGDEEEVLDAGGNGRGGEVGGSIWRRVRCGMDGGRRWEVPGVGGWGLEVLYY